MTYSILARDSTTGQMGVAVQSHWFSVGPLVAWGQAGVGVVATQALVEPAHGPAGIAAMADGLAAADALARSLATDESPEVRQVAMLDASGNAAAHTGDRCIAAAGHAVADGVSCQANMMLNDTVWGAMLEAFANAVGDLADRMMAALRAAEGQGGDIRGRQSASMLIVAARDTGRGWEDRLVDLRVEDHPAPLEELDRVLTLHRAYEHMNAFDQRMEAGEIDEAWRELAAAESHAPRNAEIAFWKAVALAERGREPEAAASLAVARAANPNWDELLRRLPAAGLFPDDPALISRMIDADPPSGER